MLSSNKKFGLNTIFSTIMQITAAGASFVMSRLILAQYGSMVNGLVSSITQFLSLITFLEFGLGAVIPSALYKPLAEKNNDQISAIVTSGTKFFKNIAFILLGYVIILVCVYPAFKREFDWFFSASLIITISIGAFAQYYFGAVDRLLLMADQKGYIQYILQIIILILNTVVSAVLISLGASIQIIKLSLSAIFLIQPITLRIYVNKHYNINRRFKYKKEPIKQKWNGIAQHIAVMVLKGTDVIVLTCFSSLSNVSVYAIYSLVICGLSNLLLSTVRGVQAYFGELWAKQELKKLYRFFNLVEFCWNTTVVFVFTCTVVLIVPFVKVYTKGISDAHYAQPLFATIMIIGYAIYCLGIPYNTMILAAGHYRQTQKKYIIAATINMSISAIAVWKFGLVGVSVGTLAAMLYQTMWQLKYNKENFIKRPKSKIFKQLLFDATVAGLIVGATFWIKLATVSYFSWIVMAVKIAVIALIIVVLMSFIFYREEIDYILSKLKRTFKKS